MPDSSGVNNRGVGVRLGMAAPVLAAALLVAGIAGATPSNRQVWTFTQPDGTSFKAVLLGDEYYAYHETADGQFIVQDPKTGTWQYAYPGADGRLEPTGLVVGQSQPVTKLLDRDKTAWLKAVEKTVDERAKFLLAGPRVMVAPTTGTIRAVMLLADFSDTTPIHSNATFASLFNAQNYNSNGAIGSVRDYYLETSYGKLTIQTDVYGWYNLPQNRAYYGANTGGPNTDIRPQQLIADAVNESSTTVDYSAYDSDGDGKVDIFGVIHQGRGEEQTGAPTDCIWSHRGVLASPITEDGKQITSYHIEPELYYTSLHTIGVICHEMGHTFELPDLYDTTLRSEGVGSWSLMGHGGWCGPSGNGAKPCHFDPWCKMTLGWLTPTVVTSTQAGISLPAWDQNATALLVPVDVFQDAEYFLVCNRYARSTGVAGTGFDAYLPGSGALVLHVDDYVPGNVDETHKKVDVEEADGLAELDNQVNRGNAGDVYTAGGTFSDAGNPNARDYAGNATGIVINNFTGAGTATMTCSVTPRAVSGEPIFYDSLGVAGTTVGYWNGDDYGCVRFTTPSGGALKRVQTFITHSGITTWTMTVYSGWNSFSNTPTGALTSETGVATTSGSLEIALSSPQAFAAGSDFWVEVRYQTNGGTNSPLPCTIDNSCEKRGYVRDSLAYGYYWLQPPNFPYDVNIRADVTPSSPTVAITCRDANPTSATSVSFDVTFSSAVSGVSTSNFSLTAVGLSGATITGVTGAGTAWVVTAGTGTGEGTLRLDMVNSTSVTDMYGNGVSNVPYTGGQAYTIDRTAPTGTAFVTDNTRAGTTTLEIQFTASDTGGASVASTSLYAQPPMYLGLFDTGLSVTGASGTFSYVTVSGDGAYGFSVRPRDTAGNAASAPTPPAQVWVLLNVDENSSYSQYLASGATSTAVFPMTDSLDVTLTATMPSIINTLVTVSRTTPIGTAPPYFQYPQYLLDEYLQIQGPTPSAPATIGWPYDQANTSGMGGLLVDTAWRFSGTTWMGTYSPTVSGNVITIPGVTSFSTWYAGNATSVPVRVSAFSVD